jgi:hypothetical protein
MHGVAADLQSTERQKNRIGKRMPLPEGGDENSPELGPPRTGLCLWGGRMKRSAIRGTKTFEELRPIEVL